MARRQVSIFINGKEVANEIKSIAAAKVKVNHQLAKMTIGTKEYTSKMKELKQLNGIIKKHNQEIRGVGGAWNKITGSVGKFAAVAGVTFAASEIINYGKELFQLGGQMELLEKKAKTVFAEALPQVTAQAEENATAMGLTTAQYIDAAAAMGDLLIPMKFTREEAAGISTSLVNLSGSLSEWTGGQRSATEITKILGKALLGEREQLKELGIALKEEDITARLAEKGLKGLTGEMLQQAKAAATLELIMEKTVDAQTAYKDNAGTLVRRTAELNAKFQQIKEVLATVLIPVFSKLLDVVTATMSLFTKSINEATGAVLNQAKTVKDLESELVPLLDRYDELKDSKVAEEQEELKKVIQQIGEITPIAVTEIDNYGNALAINADKSREFLEAEKLRLKFVNKETIESIEDQIKSYERLRSAQQENIRIGAIPIFGKLAATDIEKLSDAVNQYTNDIEGAKLQLARLTGEDIDTADPKEGKGKSDEGKAREEKLKDAAEAEKRAKERQKEADRVEKATAKNLERIQQIIAKHKEDLALAELSDNEQVLQKIRNKYAKEIEAAKEFDAEKAALRILLQQELDAQQEIFDLEAIAKKEAAHDVELEEEKTFNEEKKTLLSEIKSENDELFLSERELAILALQTHYATLLSEAEKYDIDTASIETIRREKLARINKEFDKKDKDTLTKTQAERLQVLQSSFTAIGNLFGAAFDLLSQKEGEYNAAQKVATLAQIALDTASAISSLTAASEANPANAVTFGGAGTIQFITGLTRILANIGQAKKLIQQKKDGGWLNATGKDDGISYRSKYIGQPMTGMLPNHPVLISSSSGSPVLASERGREYFVSNAALDNPYVMNYVQAIDNIVGNRTRQFAEGGSTGTAIPTNAPPPQPQDNDNNLAIQLSRLNDNLEHGIFALLDDDTVIDVFKKFNQLNKASGGGLA